MNEEIDRHISDTQLAAYAGGELTSDPKSAERVAAHLAGCSECRGALDELRAGLDAMAELPLVAAPAEIWGRIERSLAPAQAPWKRSYERIRYYVAAAAAAAVAVAIVIFYFFFPLPLRDEPTGWEVTRLGTATQPLRRGEWIERRGDDAAAAKAEVSVKAGSIGSVLIAPDTRIRLIEANAKEQRMALAYGRIQVRISAPPRLFQVETPAGTAVDLGCEYELACDRTGNGFLRVTQGWVAYEWKGRESLVPAGSSCRTSPGKQPGLPVFDDAPAAFLDGVAAFDGGAGVIGVLLDAARPRDTLTLWHLLSRVDSEASRIRIVDRMVALSSPLPQGVRRDAVLALDRDALRRWREELAWTW